MNRKEIFKNCPWMDPDCELTPITHPPHVSQRVRNASGDLLNDLVVLLHSEEVMQAYAEAVTFALQHGTAEDVEILSQWGRKNMPHIMHNEGRKNNDTQ